MIATKPHVRWLIRKDLPEVLAFADWDEEQFLACLRQRNCIGMVAEINDTVTGFMVYELCKHSLILLNIAVAPPYRHQGIGTEMIDKLKSKLNVLRRTSINLTIKETNLGGQLFFAKQDFKARMVHNSNEYTMEYSIGFPNRIVRYDDESV